MFRHHLLLAFRNFRRHKASFLINMIGLSTGLVATLLIYLWVCDEIKMDQFHEKSDRLYQVMRNMESRPGEISTQEYNSDLLAPALRAEVPQVEYAVPVEFEDCGGILTVGDKNWRATGAVAGRDFFKIFSFPLLIGNRDEVLVGTDKMVISDQLANRLFGSTEEAINQSIAFDQEDYEGIYTISGVFKKSGYQTSEQFDFLISNDLFLSRRDPSSINWGSNSVNVYLTLKEDVELGPFNEQIRNFVRSKYQVEGEPEGVDWVGQLFLRSYSEKYLYGHYENGVQAGGRIEYVWLFSIIALFILLIASVNFMNLSTAQASTKLKQVGIKKVFGVGRSALMHQFLGEALIMTFLSFLAAMAMAYLLIPSFNSITGKELNLTLDSDFLFGAIAIVLITGLMSGSYPAFYLSRFKPIEVLKGKLNASMGEFWTRKGLVIFQFCISILLIVAVSVVYQQVQFVQTKNLGYQKENVIVFDRQEKLYDNLETFLAEVNKTPGVRSSTMIEDEVTDISGWTGAYSHRGQVVGGTHPRLYEAVVGYDFTQTLSIEVKEGRSFSRQYGDESSKMMLNEMAVEVLGLSNPVGTKIRWKGQDKEVIGVTKNFHGQSLYEAIKPMAILHEPEETTKILVKLQSGAERAAIAQLQKIYDEYYSGLPFEFRFLDQQYRQLYLAEQRVATLSQYFAGIAIIISCLGLFGLVSFSAERRMKEIGIRKVLGSSNFGIASLLSKDFLTMVLIANAIALPIGYLLSKKWLNAFAYTIDLSWWHFIAAGLSALLIAWLTVGLQTFKTAQVNPVDCLRDE